MSNLLNKKNIALLAVSTSVLISGYFLLAKGKAESVVSQMKSTVEQPSLHTVSAEEKDDLSLPKKVQDSKQNSASPDSKIFSVTATDILYPEEYDFGILNRSSVLAAIGKPVKINVRSIADAQVGDVIEIQFGEHQFSSEVYEQNEARFNNEKTENGIETVTSYHFKASIDPALKTTWQNAVYGHVSYGDNGVLRGEIRIQSKDGDFALFVYKEIAYYVDEQDRSKEFTRQGYSID